MYFLRGSNFTPYVQSLTYLRLKLFKSSKIVKNLVFSECFQSESKTLEVDVFQKKTFFERDYFRNIMENNSKYQAFTRANSPFISKTTNSEFLLKLRSLADNNISGVNSECDMPDIDHFKDEIFTIDDLIETVYLLSQPAVGKKIPFDRNDLCNFLELKNKFVCKESRDLSKCLTLLHLLARFDKNMKYRVAYHTVIFVQRKFKALTDTQIIEFFYFLHFCKIENFISEIKFKHEIILASHMPEFTLDEVAIISYGLFRSEGRPGTLLSRAISERIEKDILTCNEVQMSVFCKFLHFSGKRAIASTVQNILDKCHSIIDRFTISTAIHICCSGVTVNVGNVDLVRYAIEKAKKEMAMLRMKDIERLLLASLYTNIHLPKESDIIRVITEELNNRSEEIKNFPRSYLSLLHYLIIYGVYLEDHINFALSSEFQQYLPQRSMRYKLHELLFIDVSIEIERPDYKGSRLNHIQRKKIVMKDLYRSGASTSRYNNEVLSILKDIYEVNCCALKHILPNYDTLHTVLCLNENNDAVDIEGKLENNRGVSLKAPKDGNKWLCFVFVRLQGCLSDGVTPNLITEAKLRQYKTVGFIPIMIPTSLFLKKSTRAEKQSYLLGKLEEVLKNPETLTSCMTTSQA